MTADDLYEQMKEALSFFGLRFHDRHLIKVQFQAGQIIFTYRSRSIVLNEKE